MLIRTVANGLKHQHTSKTSAWNLVVVNKKKIQQKSVSLVGKLHFQITLKTSSCMGSFNRVKTRVTAEFQGVLVWWSQQKEDNFWIRGHSWAATAGQHNINCNITVVISICSTEQQEIRCPETPTVLCRNGCKLAYVFRMPRACSSSCLLC